MAKQHAQRTERIHQEARAEILLNPGDESIFEIFDQCHVVIAVKPGLGVEPLLKNQDIERPNDRTSRNRREYFDVAQQVNFGHPAQHAQMKERSAEATTRKREPKLIALR